MNKILLSYLAGFIDGEGYIGLIKRVEKVNHKLYFSVRPCVTVGNTDKKVINILHKYFGGIVYTENRPIPRRKIYRWRITNKQVKKPLIVLLPYLKMKKKQAKLTLKYFCNNFNRITLLQKIKVLNKKGRKN